jgi:hypothetical protein
MRRMMALVAIVGRCLGIADQVRVRIRAAGYRRKAEWCERMARRSREIDAMDDATRKREADYKFDDPFLDNPAWNRRMIPYLEALKDKYSEAAANPRRPVPPDPSTPD